MIFERAKALKQDILDFRSLRENELSYWSISFKDYGLAFIGEEVVIGSNKLWFILGVTVLVSFFNLLVGIGISFFLLDRGIQMLRRYKPTLPVYFAKLFNKIIWVRIICHARFHCMPKSHSKSECVQYFLFKLYLWLSSKFKQLANLVKLENPFLWIKQLWRWKSS